MTDDSHKRLRVDIEVDPDVQMGPPDVEWETDEEDGILSIEVKEAEEKLRKTAAALGKDFVDPKTKYKPEDVVAAAGGAGPAATWQSLCDPEDEDEEEDSDYEPSTSDDESFEPSDEDEELEDGEIDSDK